MKNEQNLDEETFRLLKDRLGRALNQLQLSLTSCPQLEKMYVELPDGHRLYSHEIFSWLQAIRSDCWKFGPAEVQLRHMKAIVREQPKG
jgi:hypothetical protein